MVKLMKGNKTMFKDLDFLKDRKKTIVYVDKHATVEGLVKHVKLLVGDDQVSLYHSVKTNEYKMHSMADFRSSQKCILILTEATGMGCDISDIVHVVQFSYPDNISMLIQQLGWAACDPQLRGIGILIIPTKAGTTVDMDLVKFATTKDCHCKFHVYFNNNHQALLDCCDICHLEPHQLSDTVDNQTVHDMDQVEGTKTRQITWLMAPQMEHAKSALMAGDFLHSGTTLNHEASF